MDLGTILRVLELAGLSGVRPSWVLVGTAVAGALGYASFPPGMEFLATWPGAGALLVFAVVEHLAERDTDMLQIFGAVQLGLSGATALLASGALTRVSGQAPPWALSAGAVVLALVTIGVRRKLKLKLMELSANISTPARWMARIEEGGMVLGALLVVFAPVLLLAGVVLLAIAGAFGLGALKVADRVRRVPCSACGHPARREASRCPKCHATLAPAVQLRLSPRLEERLARVLAMVKDTTAPQA